MDLREFRFKNLSISAAYLDWLTQSQRQVMQSNIFKFKIQVWDIKIYYNILLVVTRI